MRDEESDDGAQAAVAARLPGAAALGLVAPPMGVVVPATRLADAWWTAHVLTERAARQRTTDRRVLATVWWYSVSSVLLTPALAGLVTGRPLSARLSDTRLHLLSGGVPIAATTAAGHSTDLEADLRGTLTAVVGAVAEAGGTRTRPLWAIATDSLANRLLALGRAVGDVDAVTALAGPLAAAIGAPMPAPRYVEVVGTRFTRRASCCLLYRVPHEAVCTSCPRRDPAERQVLLEDAAARIPPA
ncbi:FhuF 2Fe-2S C-terminal domain-containing protein [Modestobacter sp. DSM 44400]|uniref:(2Fe-2S)-binding protein n=1 Tax=Modestobacter sp. DSM 44400 TaxID=1550230 RepID=UPI0008962A36|nr:(2Fe-2S)-binding protein [Modestobacter sp. DSM 44400]SDY16558.1 FhuF 2Fe-2S C-terminal domain-containing protein [Modestobacter sp. DSM 44400]